MEDPTETDILISRLIARIAELEERLYKHELEAPVAPDAPKDGSKQSVEAKPKESFFSALKEGLRQIELRNSGFAAAAVGSRLSSVTAPQGAKAGGTEWFFSVGKQVQEPAEPRTSHAGQANGDGPHADSSSAASMHPSPSKSQLSDSAQASPQGEGTGYVGPTLGVVQPLPSTSQPAAPQASIAKLSTATDWFSGLFKKDKDRHVGGGRGVGGRASGTETSVAAQMEARGRALEASMQSEESNGSYYRYVFDPVDVEAEMEVTARVRKAAAEALMEAQEKLRAAEEAQAAMQEQLQQAQEVAQEAERLKAENSAMLEVKKSLEDHMIGMRAQLEEMQQASQSLQGELEGMRAQSKIWEDNNNSEAEKLKQENALIRNQMQTRLNEMQNLKSKLADADAERQRLQRDMEDQASKLQWLQRINAQLEASTEQLEQYRKAAADFQERFIRERNVRRKLHEQLQVLKGNIRVMCRVRPPNGDVKPIVSYPLEGLLAITPPDRRPQEFEFDHVFGPEASQEAIFEEVSPLVRSCADGFNVCIFAYGQTGSGKTFTMEGPQDKPGINVRALQELFRIAGEEGADHGWGVEVSMMEIYNEAVHDLLRSEVTKPLDVSALGPGELPPGMDRVPGITWRKVDSLEQVKQVLREGSKNRATASTALNAHSSRSHALLSVKVNLQYADGRRATSLIHLVDLAGSERVDKSEVSGQQMKEAQAINKSLSALGDVISALQRRNSHIPFRNSKLTQVLQDSLCGTSKVLLVCNISPEPVSSSETLSSLNFAHRAAQVELGAARRVERITPADRMTSSGGGSSLEHSATTTPERSRTPVTTPATRRPAGRV